MHLSSRLTRRLCQSRTSWHGNIAAQLGTGHGRAIYNRISVKDAYRAVGPAGAKAAAPTLSAPLQQSLQCHSQLISQSAAKRPRSKPMQSFGRSGLPIVVSTFWGPGLWKKANPEM